MFVIGVGFQIASFDPKQSNDDALRYQIEKRDSSKGANPAHAPGHARPPVYSYTSPNEYQPDCNKKQNADLCAQLRMAVSAERQAWYTKWGFYILIAAFGAASWAAWEARKAAKTARETVVSENRAWMKILDFEVDFVADGVTNPKLRMKISVQNIGKYVAQNVDFSVDVIDDLPAEDDGGTYSEFMALQNIIFDEHYALPGAPDAARNTYMPGEQGTSPDEWMGQIDDSILRVNPAAFFVSVRYLPFPNEPMAQTGQAFAGAAVSRRLDDIGTVHFIIEEGNQATLVR